MKSGWKWALAVLVVLTVLARLPSLVLPVWSVDEGISSVAANTILAGGVPYRDAVDHRAPVTSYLYALVFLLFGRNNIFALHAVLMLLLIVAAGLVFAIGRRVMGDRGGLLAALVFAFKSNFTASPDNLYAYHTEWNVILFSCAASWLVLDVVQHRRRPWLTVLAGVLFGLAVFSKQPAILEVLGALAFLAYLAVSRPAGFRVNSGREAARQAALLLSGLLVVTVAIGGYFAARGAWREFWFYCWNYNVGYYLAAAPLTYRLTHAVAGVAIAFSAWRSGFLALLGGLIACLHRMRASSSTTARGHLQIYVVLWAVSSLVAVVGSGRNFGHYYIQLMPAASVLAAIPLDMACAWLFNLAPHRGEARARSARVAIWLTLGLAAFAFVGDPIRTYTQDTLQLINRPDAGADQVSRYIADHSPPDARVFVWGFVPEIYVLADRDPASRFSYCIFHTGLIPWVNIAPGVDTERWAVPGARDTLLADLRARPPRFIVDTAVGDIRHFGKYPLEKYPALRDFVRADYRVAADFRNDAGALEYRLYERVGQP